jgi:hypothetical protein
MVDEDCELLEERLKVKKTPVGTGIRMALAEYPKQQGQA